MPSSTKRQCRGCGKPMPERACDVVGRGCYTCSTGRPRILTPETLTVYVQTARPPLVVTRTVLTSTRRVAE